MLKEHIEVIEKCPTVLIQIEGGEIISIHTSVPVTVVIQDWDNSKQFIEEEDNDFNDEFDRVLVLSEPDVIKIIDDNFIKVQNQIKENLDQ